MGEVDIQQYYQLPDGRYISYYELANNPQYSTRKEETWYKVSPSYVLNTPKTNWYNNGKRLNKKQIKDRFGHLQHVLVQNQPTGVPIVPVQQHTWVDAKGNAYSQEISKLLEQQYKNKLNGIQPTVSAFYEPPLYSESNPEMLDGVVVIDKVPSNYGEMRYERNQEEFRKEVEAERAALKDPNRDRSPQNQTLSNTGTGHWTSSVTGAINDQAITDRIHRDPTSLSSLFGINRINAAKLLADTRDVYDVLPTDLLNQVRENALYSLDENEYLNRFNNLWNLSGRPSIYNKETVPFFLKLSVGDEPDRAFYHELFNSIYAPNTIDDVLAEFSHPIQELVNGPNSLTENLINLKEQWFNQNYRYANPEHYEYQTHSIIEPELEAYMGGGTPYFFDKDGKIIKFQYRNLEKDNKELDYLYQQLNDWYFNKLDSIYQYTNNEQQRTEELNNLSSEDEKRQQKVYDDFINKYRVNK